MEMFKGLSILAFNERFKTDLDCVKYLSEIKWAQGYACCRCKHNGYRENPQKHTRKCTKCKHIESPTAGTLFHKVKFPIRKAFYIVFLVVTNTKGASSYELGRKLDLRQGTCWLFKRKVMAAMASEGNHKLQNHVEVDEFLVGGHEEGKPGRSKGKKRLVVLAIEKKAGGISRTYAQVIENAGSKEIQPFMEKFIAEDAEIKTDNWRAYKNIQKKFTRLKQEKSENGKNFKLMHRQIMMFKAWLRGTHHRCKDLQAYLDEYCYRFNRAIYPSTIFHRLVEKMIVHLPCSFNDLKWGK